MKRALFMIVRKGGFRASADNIQSTWEQGTMHPMISYVCSGIQEQMRLEDVERIEVSTAEWCGHCDQPLPNYIQE